MVELQHELQSNASQVAWWFRVHYVMRRTVSCFILLTISFTKVKLESFDLIRLLLYRKTSVVDEKVFYHAKKAKHFIKHFADKLSDFD